MRPGRMNESSSVLGHGAPVVLMPRVGDVVGGKYRLTRRIGEGGMGVVFEAVHSRLRQSVAIKFLRPDVLLLPDAVERFDREARASGRMRGPHVVHLLDVDTDVAGRPYMVMELLRGRDLEAELRAHGPMSVPEVVDWALQACAALTAAHAAGIVHRDLKPSNLFLAEESGARVLKVLDFGISKFSREADLAVTSTAMIVGTPLYMSPEQVRSSKDVDARTDIWSLGVILYELIAGAPPFLGSTTAAIAAIVADATPSLRDVRPEVPEELERVIVTALAKDPNHRFPSAEALAAALMPFASAEGIDGPFSLRPSSRAFDVASSTMARAPSALRASYASDLLNLPTARDTIAGVPEHPRWLAIRTFAGAMAIGIGFATAATLAAPAESRRPARTQHAPATLGTAALEHARGPAIIRAKSHAACGASSHVNCLNPSAGSNDVGGSPVRRSSEP